MRVCGVGSVQFNCIMSQFSRSEGSMVLSKTDHSQKNKIVELSRSAQLTIKPVKVRKHVHFVHRVPNGGTYMEG